MSENLAHEAHQEGELVFVPEQPFLPDERVQLGNGRFAVQMRKRAEILAMTRMICSESGLAGVHMRELARRTGVTPPTIYNNIGRREDVLHKAILESLEGKISLAEKFCEEAKLPFPIAYARLTWATLEEDRGYYRAVVLAAMGGEADIPIARDCINRMTTSHLGSLEQLSARGQLRTSKLSMHRAAHMMALHNSSTINDWAQGNLDSESFRSELLYGAALPLLALAAKDFLPKVEALVEELDG
ncbi:MULTISPECIES: TetR/AcrR family transcriptional regulator [Sphingobium]|uniref:TetR/AcrR family transcriptional regulator n=1 Tax=Sphingobium sp. MI1205 TaxID=407020 RepID=UPI000770368E|nr:TetR/AcrR family transcriptional regulator [Sphingobium sp. MI1205]AMK16884.1 regulatory protein TetR [Sphingobium sp. MI1205]